MVAKWKFEEVEKLKSLIESYPVVGIVDMTNIPARQLQNIRAQLRGDVLIRMSKKRLIKLALEKAKREDKILRLKDYLKGQPALILTKLNPFKLYKILEKNKSPAPAKPNMVAPKDIVVPKGETPFAPGPILTELQAVGIPTKVEKGKVVVTKDVVVAKKGEVISEQLANVLNRLGIEPMEVGLNLLAAYEDGIIYTPEVLAVDSNKVMQDFIEAYRRAVNLSVNSGYLTKETAPVALAKAFIEARMLAINATIFEKDVMPDILAKAHMQMLSVASRLREDALDDELKDIISKQKVERVEKKEEKKEEVKEEKEEKKEEGEEEALGGLASLFG